MAGQRCTRALRPLHRFLQTNFCLLSKTVSTTWRDLAFSNSGINAEKMTIIYHKFSSNSVECFNQLQPLKTEQKPPHWRLRSPLSTPSLVICKSRKAFFRQPEITRSGINCLSQTQFGYFHDTRDKTTFFLPIKACWQLVFIFLKRL